MGVLVELSGRMVQVMTCPVLMVPPFGTLHDRLLPAGAAKTMISYTPPRPSDRRTGPVDGVLATYCTETDWAGVAEMLLYEPPETLAVKVYTDDNTHAGWPRNEGVTRQDVVEPAFIDHQDCSTM